MNTEADFLAALRASPDDSLLVSAYADVLEERADPRAAYLRDDAVRPWMGGDFRDPLPALLDAVFTGRHSAKAQSALARVGEPAAVPLAELLTRNDAGVRSRASLALRKLGVAARPAVPRLLELLRHDDRAVRLEAVRVLRKANPVSGTDTANLREALDDMYPPVRAAARLVLQSMGAKSAVTGELAGLLVHPAVRERCRAAASLAALRTKAARDLVARLLDDDVAGVRVAAARALGSLFAALPEDRPLLRALVDADDGVREAAATGLRRPGRPLSATAVEGLRRALSDDAGIVRAAAARSLAEHPDQAAAALAELSLNVADADVSVRLAAVGALQRVTVATAGAIDPLVSALADDDDGVALAAAAALSSQDTIPAGAAEPLTAMLRRMREDARFDDLATPLYEALSRIRPVSDIVLDAFAEEMADDRPYCFYAATCASRIGPAGAKLVPAVLALVDASVGTPHHVARAAHDLADAAAVDLIVAHLRDNVVGRNELIAGARGAALSHPAFAAEVWRAWGRATGAAEQYAILHTLTRLVPATPEAVALMLRVAETPPEDAHDYRAVTALDGLQRTDAVHDHADRILAIAGRPDVPPTVAVKVHSVLSVLAPRHEGCREYLLDFLTRLRDRPPAPQNNPELWIADALFGDLIIGPFEAELRALADAEGHPFRDHAVRLLKTPPGETR